MKYIDYHIVEGYLICQQKKSRTSTSSIQTAELLEYLSWSHFNILTGKKIDFQKRIGKNIRVLRGRGHVYILDHEWILGQIYRKDNIEAKCYHITEDMALLSIRDSMKIVTSDRCLDWIVI